MKTAFRTSLVLNAALVACLLYLLATQRHLQNISPPPVGVETTQPLQSIQTAPVFEPPPAQQSQSEPFRWSQLQSASDYRIYIKNLRNIGCPEQTLRDIVSGNVDRAFVAERRQLNLDSDGNDPGPWSAPAEMRFIDELLGADAGSGMNGTLAQGQSQSQDSPTYPLVLQKVNLDALGLSDDQKQVIAQLQQQFIDAIGGPYQDPNDPAYLQRWQKAQPESDDMFKALLGIGIYQNYQLAAASPQSEKTAALK